MSLLLFDIDGTLLLSGGAGVRAMTRAFEQVFGMSDAFAISDVAGRTDRYLVGQALQRAGLDDSPDNHRRLREAYIPLLREEMRRPASGRWGVMPGVGDLLDAVHGHDGFHLALLTGNFEPAAYIKLAHFGLDGFFPWGVFGEESPDRNDLGRVALRRAEQRAVPVRLRERIVVIGDTPHDIACARAIGAKALAVATGNFSVHELRAAGADLALADLSDTGAVLDVLAA